MDDTFVSTVTAPAKVDLLRRWRPVFPPPPRLVQRTPEEVAGDIQGWEEGRGERGREEGREEGGRERERGGREREGERR